MKLRAALSATLSLGLLFAAARAKAQTGSYQITASGIITNSLDVTGIFGIPANQNYTEDTGQSFTATFTIDPRVGSYNNLTYTPQNSSQLIQYGVQGYPNNGDSISATFEVNGVSVPISNTGFTSLIIFDPPNISFGSSNNFTISSANQYSNGSSNGLQIIVSSPSIYFPFTLGSSFNIDVSGADSSNSGYDFQELGANGDLDVTNISAGPVSSSGPVSATPEPATWMLMIAGVGLAGLGLRMGRRSLSLAAA